MKTKLSLKKTAVIVIGISVIGKLFGFVRELLLANYFGTSGIVDVYLMSMTIPSILFGFLPAIGIGFTPIYFEISNDNKKNRFTSNALIASAVFAILCIILTIVLRNQIVSICAPGFSVANKELTSRFLNITVWCVLFNTPVQILTAYLNCNQDYVNSNISNLFVSVTQAVFVIIAASVDAIFLPIGIVVPWIFQLIWLFASSKKKGLLLCRYSRHDEYIRRLLIISVPLFFSNILVDINGFVDKMLSSSLDEGKLSALNYAFTLRAVFVTAASAVITTIFYPRIAERVKENENKAVCYYINRGMDSISFIILPIMLLCIIFANEIITIVLKRGSFDVESAMITTLPFIMYMLSLIVLVWRELLIKIMYSYNQTKRNLLFSLFEISINICLSLVLVNTLEHAGLALATTIAAYISFPIYIYNIKKTIPELGIKNSFYKILKEIIAAGIMVLISKLIFTNVLGSLQGGLFEMITVLLLSCIVGLSAYLLITYLLCVEECRMIVGRIYSILKKR